MDGLTVVLKLFATLLGIDWKKLHGDKHPFRIVEDRHEFNVDMVKIVATQNRITKMTGLQKNHAEVTVKDYPFFPSYKVGKLPKSCKDGNTPRDVYPSHEGGVICFSTHVVVKKRETERRITLKFEDFALSAEHDDFDSGPELHFAVNEPTSLFVLRIEIPGYKCQLAKLEKIVEPGHVYIPSEIVPVVSDGAIEILLNKPRLAEALKLSTWVTIQ